MSAKIQVQWRRAKVLELLTQGYSQIEIAKHLQVDEPTISRDIKFMRNEALQNVRDYTTEQLPLQLKIFIKALEGAIQTYWRLSQEAKDDRDKIDAMEYYIDSHKTLWALLSGAESLTHAWQFMTKMEKEKKKVLTPPLS